MATYTTNYNLSKPEVTDSQQSFINDYATNMEIIDENLGGSDAVTWTQIQQTGTKIAEIDINGTSQDVYAPQGGVGNISALAYKQLTESEYSALTPAEKENGVIYFVSNNSTGAKGLTVIRISQADYNNLTPQEKNNGVPYFVY